MTRLSGRWVIALEGDRLPDRNLVGGKAWSIARMRALGLNVPPGFVITTRACSAFLESGRLPADLETEIAEGIAWLEERTGRCFGAGPRALLVSVRSGAPVSMPGMMDTILNLGINTATAAALAAECGSKAFAEDTHRRFIELYGSTVLKADVAALGNIRDISAWRQAIARASGAPISEDVVEQLHGAVRAVFESWNSRRARRYREHHGIPDHLGTAVAVQAMVFGNLDEQSGTGVLFSRNPLTGVPVAFGEFLPRAQGEDVVSGKHTPLSLAAMQERVPAAFEELLAAAHLLEQEHADVQDIEFTVESGRLYLLQTRSAKRSPQAAVRIAVDLVREGRCDPDTAFSKLTAEQIRVLLSPRLAAGATESAQTVARGEGASPGVGCGVVVTDPDEAELRAKAGEHVVLARATTSPNDVHGMIAAVAIMTEEGGATSHAAVVSRALGRPCVVGCGPGSVTRLAGRVVTVDGQGGTVFDGELEVVAPDEDADEGLARLAAWARSRSPIVVERVAPADRTLIDLDAIERASDPAWLLEYLRGLGRGTAVRGRLLANDSVVSACVAAGVSVLIAVPSLPVLLAAVQAATAVSQTHREEIRS